MNEKSLFRRILGGLDAFAPHLLMTFSLMIMSFYFITIVNDAMGFLTARISACFQLGYLTLSAVVALICLIAGRVRLAAVPTLAVSAVLFVPSLISIVKNSSELLSKPLYQNVLIVCAFLTFILAIAEITVMRKKAMAEYQAANPENNEKPQEK
ncbi:MAG: hypothetical protein MJ062_02075 [Oscillospiraceae bacterium]|nr:hypothetical protein [Oscillospiraceae bacterium]